MLLLFSIFVLIQPSASAQNNSTYSLIIVANTDDVHLTFTQREVRNLFMGRVSKIQLEPVALPPESPIRVLFNTKVVGLTEARIQSYWAQMRFSGRNRPPRELSDVEAVLRFIQQHKNTVAYLPAGIEIPQELTVIYRSN
ncbi:hypothetical protein DXX93_02190 [Thalassotalea euphylliae]|uniref:Phosphate ABC transporter substrate-binding protein n=1 Tax=Thalassotalea euphylliae TaxID=1655234 RepID=A0A3E0TWE4_9GAMM|nr:hypothetical protein DXX93_02190 [Thalassotalea euphylliae]